MKTSEDKPMIINKKEQGTKFDETEKLMEFILTGKRN